MGIWNWSLVTLYVFPVVDIATFVRFENYSKEMDALEAADRLDAK